MVSLHAFYCNYILLHNLDFVGFVFVCFVSMCGLCVCVCCITFILHSLHHRFEQSKDFCLCPIVLHSQLHFLS